MTNLVIRPMKEEDVSKVHAILSGYAKENILLWREPDDLRKHLSNFAVAELQGNVCGCVALADYGNGLYEIRSLAVAKEYCGQGIGKKLVLYIIDQAKRLGAKRLFALTLQVDFFRKVGFRISDRMQYPEKIWKDCALCFRRHQCDETLLEYIISPGDSCY